MEDRRLEMIVAALVVATCEYCCRRGFTTHFGGRIAEYDETEDTPCPRCEGARMYMGQHWEQPGRYGHWTGGITPEEVRDYHRPPGTHTYCGREKGDGKGMEKGEKIAP